MSRITITLYGVLCYALFNAVFLYLVAFLLEIGVPKTINSGDAGSTARAVLINLALIAAFGLSHSVMAREGFKRWWTRYIPKAAERSTYVLQSSLFLGCTMYFWQPMPSTIWHVEGVLSWPFYAAAAAGCGLVLISTFLIDHFELFGLRQIWCHLRGTEMPVPEFRTPALYRIVRHPMQLGIVILLFSTPHMTVGHMLFASAMTAYVFIGLYFEERALRRTFGERYAAYQQSVPMLIPGLPGRRKTAAT
jgi:protein-S-isoprenylcysteine O-methyltransferase Ste14